MAAEVIPLTAQADKFPPAMPIILPMHTDRLRQAQLALENLPFARHQTRTVLDMYAADGATTLYLQYFMPYSTVFA